ncbi:hypothetical protein, partial [Methylobacterium symbioticum]|uniref:hypothetical protein n=1 Tax=Methylobacterium symbioticum TaxID=2584084 RepID=UPI001AEDDF0F
MLIVVIDDPYDRFRFNHQAYEMPVGGGIHRISSAPSDQLGRPAALAQRHSHCNHSPGHPELILDAPSAKHIQEGS